MKKSTNPSIAREYLSRDVDYQAARGLPRAQELFATVTIGGAGMRLNMYNVYNVDSAIYIHYMYNMYPPTRVHSHCWIAGIEAKRVQCLRLRLNCALVWWEATSVGSICLLVNSRGSVRESGEKFSAHALLKGFGKALFVCSRLKWIPLIGVSFFTV